jgi:hypothetical protein
MSLQEQILISAIRFQFLPDEWGRRLDTLPFYKKYIRNFLIWNVGRAAWVKGGSVKREAYLVFHAEIKDEVVKLLTKAYYDGVKIKAAACDPIRIVEEAVTARRTVIGVLDLGHSKIGKPVKTSNRWIPIVDEGYRGWMCALCGADFYNRDWLWRHEKVCPGGEAKR